MITSLATSGVLAVMPGALGPGGTGGVVPISPYLGQVATRSYFPNNISALSTQGCFTSVHYAMVDMNDGVRVEYAGAAIDYLQGGQIIPSAAAVTYAIAIQYNGVVTPFTWVDAGTGGVAQPGLTTGPSDAAPVYPRKGEMFTLTGYVTSPSVNSIVTMAGNTVVARALGEKTTFGTSVTDNHLTPNLIVDDGTTSNVYPLWILGTTSQASYLAIEDSIGVGSHATPNAHGDTGIICQSIGATHAYINAGINGQRALFVPQNFAWYKRALAYVTHVVIQTGINDIYIDGKTAAQALASNALIAKLCQAKTVIAATVTPVTTGSWGSAGSQTLTSAQTELDTYNAAIRALPSWAAAYVDVRSAVEDASNPGKWKSPGYTDDGLHPVNVGYAAVLASGVINGTTLAALTPRTQAWTPADLGVGPTDLIAWWDVSNISLLKAVPDGSRIESAVGPTPFIQPTSGNRPIYTPSAINGLPALVFNGSPKVLNSADSPARNLTRNLVAVTDVTVAYASSFAGNAFLLNIPRNSGGNSRASQVITITTGLYSSQARRLDADAAVVVNSSISPTLNVPFIFMSSFKPGAGTIQNRINGVDNGAGVYASTGPLPNTGSAPSLDMGASFNGGIGEQLVFGRELTSGEKVQLEAYLKAKWGTP